MLALSSITSVNSNLIDNIRSSIIELGNNPTENLLKESILYLDSSLDEQTTDELFTLFSSCFSLLPDQPTEFFNEIFENSTKNSNWLLFFAMTFSNYNINSSFPNLSDLLTSIIDQIIQHIKNPTKEFTINANKIDSKYVANFIIDILLITELNENLISTFLPFIFNHEKVSKTRIKKLIQKIINNGFLTSIPEFLLSNKIVFDSLSQDDLSVLLSEASKETFIQFLSLIEETFSETKENLNQPFFISIFNKLFEYKIEWRKKEKLSKIIINTYQSYIGGYHDVFNYFQTKIELIPNLIIAMEMLPSIFLIPFDLIERDFLKIEDLVRFEEVVDHTFIFEDTQNIPIYSDEKFWIHLFSIVSNSKEKCSEDFVMKMVRVFENNIDQNKSFEIIESMILSLFPSTNNGNYFLHDFINNLNDSFKNNFNENIVILFKKIIEKDAIPLPSFWSLFDYKKIESFLQEKNNDPVILYAYQFSSSFDENSKININNVKINCQLNENNSNLIIKFIKNKNFDDLVTMSKEILSIIIAAYIFVSRNTKINIEGLNVETVLPFIAISIYLSFTFSKKFELAMFYEADLFLKSLKELSKSNSPLYIESINSIITNYSIDIISPFIYKELEFMFFDILINNLIDDVYMPDKLLLLGALFALSDQYSTNRQIQYLFDKNGINFFKYLIRNMSKIEDFESLQKIGLNLNAFNSEKVTTFSIDTIQNSKIYNDVVNTICFLGKYCKNVPKIKIQNMRNLIKICNEKITNLKVDELYFIDRLIRNSNLNINQKQLIFKNIPIDKISTDKLINEILTDQQQEKNSFYFDFLFKKLMKDKSIATNYYTILFEKNCDNHEINLECLLRKYENQYFENVSCFINAFINMFGFQAKSTAFIKKLDFKRVQCPSSNFAFSIISKLLKNGSYQAFICLLNISSSFPFLFANNHSKLFTKIISKLDSFSLLFEKSPICEDLKVSLSVFYFLHSLLYSVDILDSFVPWVFTKILTFSPSQLISIVYILTSLFNTKKVSNAMLALSIKYDFPGIVSKLLSKNVSKDIQNIIFNFLAKFYELLLNLEHKRKLILVDEMSKAENPFSLLFNGSTTIHPVKLKDIELPDVNNDEISDFIDEIRKIKPFYISENLNGNSNNEKFQHILVQILTHYEMKYSDKSQFTKNIPDTYKVKNIRFCAKQPNWIYKWVIKKKTFPCLIEHKKKLTNVYQKLFELDYSYDKSDDEDYDNDSLDVDLYFTNIFCLENLFSFLIEKIVSNDDSHKNSIIALINVLSKKKAFMANFIDSINIFINENRDDIELVTKLLDFARSADIFQNYHGSGNIINSLINIGISPEYSEDVNFLSVLSSILLDIDDLPANANVLVVSILKHPKLFCQALELYQKIGNNNFDSNIQKYIINALEKQFKSKKKISIQTFKLILQIDPSLIKSMNDVSAEILNDSIKTYKKNKNEETLDFIFDLLNILAPKRQENQLIIPLDEIDFTMSFTSNRIQLLSQAANQTILRQAPQNLTESDPFFWNLYGQHRLFLNEIVTNNEEYFEKVKFLKDFPELVSFEKRLSFFHSKMKDKIDRNERLEISVNRSNVLVDSYQILNDKSYDEWLYDIEVKFKGESGIDMGGLTKEWFTLIVKDIFNPNFALFSLYENKSYQPNQFSGINQEHLEFFNFAGKIIARSIIQGQCINAHFCRSFCRQILHQQVKLKDIGDIDESIYNSLQIILNEDVEPLELNFTIDVNEYGSQKTVLLKENGDEIDVNNENKVEYASLYVNYHLRKSIISQINAFIEGFNWLIPHEDIRIFSPNELDLIICGIPEIDINDLRENTVYTEPYDDEHPVIEMFFSAISKWDPDNLAKFLLFLTGSSQVPINGFKDYSDKGKPITIGPGGDRSRFCVAHTCFNQLDLPEYENENELNDKLLLSIQECEFGIL